MFDGQDNGKVMARKGFFGKKELVPRMNVNSPKEFMWFWGVILCFFVFIKLVSGLLFGFDGSWPISGLSFFVGLLLSIVTKNGMHFSIGVVIAFVCTYVLDLIKGLF